MYWAHENPGILQHLFSSISIMCLSLQHLVRLRWDELSPEERREFTKVSIDLMNEIANSFEEWALKSQTAALIAEVYVCFHVGFH